MGWCFTHCNFETRCQFLGTKNPRPTAWRNTTQWMHCQISLAMEESAFKDTGIAAKMSSTRLARFHLKSSCTDAAQVDNTTSDMGQQQQDGGHQCKHFTSCETDCSTHQNDCQLAPFTEKKNCVPHHVVEKGLSVTWSLHQEATQQLTIKQQSKQTSQNIIKCFFQGTIPFRSLVMFSLENAPALETIQVSNVVTLCRV